MGELVDYFLSFAPWIGYVVLTHVLGSWSDGYALGLGLAFALVVWRTIRRDSRFLDIGTLCFCGVMTAVSVSDPTSPLRPYNLPLSMAAVAAISGLSLAMRSPFTFRIARRHVESEVLDDPQRLNALYKAHVAATSWWAGSQIVAAAASAICVGARSTVGAAVVQSVGTLFPAGMTRYHHGRGTREPPSGGAARCSLGGAVQPTEPEPSRGQRTSQAGPAATGSRALARSASCLLESRSTKKRRTCSHVVLRSCFETRTSFRQQHCVAASSIIVAADPVDPSCR